MVFLELGARPALREPPLMEGLQMTTVLALHGASSGR